MDWKEELENKKMFSAINDQLQHKGKNINENISRLFNRFRQKRIREQIRH